MGTLSEPKPRKKLGEKPGKPKASLVDDGEFIGLMEPMTLSESLRHRPRLNDLVFEVTKAATAFRVSLPDGMVEAVCDLVRSMNCYYSNLIEGHNTHPIDIERALLEDYAHDPRRRDLQLEAKAHIATQRFIDEGSLKGHAASIESLTTLHRKFCEALPDSLLWVENAETGQHERVIPGVFRTSHVRVGRHIAVGPGAIPRFLTRFSDVYRPLSNFETLLQAAAAHHRLLWIHPFADGNGRVTRLMSYAMLLEALDTGGIWSIARGLARQESAYKGHLASCDLARRNDLDGRGNLSEEALAEFTAFFLEACLDQIRFMSTLTEPNAVRGRVLDWAREEEKLSSALEGATKVLAHILTHGELQRRDVPEITGLSAEKSRRLTAALHKRGIITAPTHKAPFRIAFPAALAPRLMPGLYPALPKPT